MSDPTTFDDDELADEEAFFASADPAPQAASDDTEAPAAEVAAPDDDAPDDDAPAAEVAAPEAEPEVLTEDDLLDEDDEDEDDDEPPRVESPYDRPGQWFVVHTYAGYENKV